ncbi:MAG TPA: six-cysteine ranthipeptide SCIFF [Bacillota bacterium]|nr:six-cysteine ranthipeptide SCIFF [Bacillota bacterium]
MEHIRIINRGTVFCREKEGCRECPTSCQSACKTSCTVGSQICRRDGKHK